MNLPKKANKIQHISLNNQISNREKNWAINYHDKIIHKHLIKKYPHIDHALIKNAFCRKCEGPICNDFWVTRENLKYPSELNGTYYDDEIKNGKKLKYWLHKNDSYCLEYIEHHLKILKQEIKLNFRPE